MGAICVPYSLRGKHGLVSDSCLIKGQRTIAGVVEEAK